MLLWFREEFLFSHSHLSVCIFVCSFSMPTCLYVTYLALPCSVFTEVAAATGYSCQNPLTAHSMSSLRWTETDGHFWQPLSQQLQKLLVYFCVYLRSWLLTATESLLSLRADGGFHSTCLELMCRGYTTGLVEASSVPASVGCLWGKGQDFICFTRCLSGGAWKDWIAGVVFILGNAVFSVSEKEYIWRCVSVKLGMCSLKSLVDNIPYLPVKGMSRYMLVLHKASVCNKSSALHWQAKCSWHLHRTLQQFLTQYYTDWKKQSLKKQMKTRSLGIALRQDFRTRQGAARSICSQIRSNNSSLAQGTAVTNFSLPPWSWGGERVKGKPWHLEISQPLRITPACLPFWQQSRLVKMFSCSQTIWKQAGRSVTGAYVSITFDQNASWKCSF